MGSFKKSKLLKATMITGASILAGASATFVINNDKTLSKSKDFSQNNISSRTISLATQNTAVSGMGDNDNNNDFVANGNTVDNTKLTVYPFDMTMQNGQSNY
ncbi:hypothetical protein D8X55_04905, partial [Malacoplasma penetrans]|uniref:hypothetical protein n=1 Tax=Malacoplasma penetrans TaxID=28227 RepID=UPI001027194A